jgi:hypothetical protein
MLDTDTNRRIDTVRDILVSKVPDPKSQVEQIPTLTRIPRPDEFRSDGHACRSPAEVFLLTEAYLPAEASA